MKGRKILSGLVLLVCTLVGIGKLVAGEILTTAERSNYTKTTLYDDLINFLFEVQKQSDLVKILPLCQTVEGRLVPLVVISNEGISCPYEVKMTGKPVVLVQANIHPGEVEGKEATLMLTRDLGTGKITGILDNQVILVIPDVNADGNEKLDADNRQDNGPELAGVRHNGQFLDLNRDFIKLESPEVSALVQLFRDWDPVLFVDMHTKNGSYHREPVTYSTLSHPNSDQGMQSYMWQKLFPAVQKILKEQYGYDAIPYGNFIDRVNPEQGWINDACEARYSTNYAGLRNRFTILNENYPHADFKTRVLASYAFIRSILQYTHQNILEMDKIVRTVDLATKTRFYHDSLALEHRIEKLFDLTVKSYRFEKEKIKPEDRDKYPPWIQDVIVKKTESHQEYRLPYLAQAVATHSISLPYGYVLLPYHYDIVAILKKHGVIVEKIRKAIAASVEEFKIKEITLSKTIYQGRVFVNIKGEYQKIDSTIPANSYFISMQQPLARLVAVLLEPESGDGLLRWGFFNKVLVHQWGENRPRLYPVYRITNSDILMELIQE